MNGLTPRRSRGLQPVVDALSAAIELEPNPTFVRLREACERRMLLEALQMPPWWQAQPDRYQSELESARPLLESGDEAMEVRVQKDGGLLLEGVLTLVGGERKRACVIAGRSFPEHPPEVRLLGGRDEWIVLPLPLAKVWRPDMDCGFALRAGVDFINEGLRQGRKERR